jgi:ethanolamine permease
VLQAVSFILLRTRMPNIERPYRSPFGILGAGLTLIIALVTIYFQVTDAAFRDPVLGVAIYYAVMIVYFAVFGRKQLVLSPEEEFAVSRGKAEYKTH